MKNINKIRDMKHMEFKRHIRFKTKKEAFNFVVYFDAIFDKPVRIGIDRDAFGEDVGYGVDFKLNNDDMRILIDVFNLECEKYARKSISRMYWKTKES